jgi:hypothetical protein
MVFGIVYYAVVSIHWILTGDSIVMHYVIFLTRHGLKPYTDITDNNMPGTYLTEALSMGIFGTGDIGWRIYDYFLLATMIAALIVIARSRDWLAGFFAGGLFIVMHASEGPAFSVEREQIIMVLLLLGYAALFAAVRHRLPALMLVLGLTGGIATSIKPTFLPLPFALLALMVFVLYRRKTSSLPYLAWALLGFATVFALDIGYLLHYQVLMPFLFIVRTVSPIYASIARLSTRAMFASLLPRNMRLLPFVILAPIIAMGKRRIAWTWEQWAIALGVAFGLFSFFVQGKGFIHHRYTFIVLLFLLIGYELLEALRHRGWPRILSFVAFAFILLWIVPQDLRATRPSGQQTPPLQVDLQRLGGASDLQDKVQCFDMVYGCFSALYHLQIVENTGYTGDLLFFTHSFSPTALYYKQKYWDLARQDPAAVLVVSNEWFGQANSFDKLNVWPQFVDYLNRNYTLVIERRFSPTAQEDNPNKFRIYVRNGTPLLAKAQALERAGQL